MPPHHQGSLSQVTQVGLLKEVQAQQATIASLKARLDALEDKTA